MKPERHIAYKKCLKIIDSCETVDQIESAIYAIGNYNRMYNDFDTFFRLIQKASNKEDMLLLGKAIDEELSELTYEIE